MTRKSLLAAVPIVAITAAAAIGGVTAAHAQGPGGPGGPGGFQPSPEMMKKIQAWQHWRDSHKNISALQQTIRGFTEMENDPSTKITPAEAKKIVPILKSWRNKPVMSDEQARTVNKQLTASLTLPQIKKIATAPGGGRRRGGFGGFGGGPGGGGPGGGGPGGGGPRPGGGGPGGPGGPGRGFTMPDPKDYNPLNPDSLPFERMRSRAKERMDGLIASLQSRAAS